MTDFSNNAAVTAAFKTVFGKDADINNPRKDKLWTETMLDYVAAGYSDMEAMALANKEHGIKP